MSLKPNSQQTELFDAQPVAKPVLSLEPDSKSNQKPACGPKPVPEPILSAAPIAPISARQIDRPALWLCIELPWLVLQTVFPNRSIQKTPSEENKLAAAVYQQVSGRDEIVIASRLARRQGLRPGMTLSQAYALSPQLQALPRQPQAEQTAIWQVAALAYQFSAQVGVFDDRSVLLELGRSLRWFGCNRLLRDLRRRLQQAGHIVRIGIAPSANAARLLASRQQQAMDRHQAVALLRDCSLSELPIEPSFQQSMRACGLRQLGDLLRLSNAAVRRRFDTQTAKFLRDLNQAEPPLLTLYRPPTYFEQALELPSPTIDSEMIEVASQRLLEQLHYFLLSNNKVLNTCELRLELEPQSAASPEQQELVQTISLGLRRHSSELAYMQLVLGEKLNQLKLLSPVVKLVLSAEELLDHNAEQPTLFETQRNQYGDSAQWLDQLSARLGADHLHTLSGHAEHRPELSWRWSVPGQSTKSEVDGRPRPLWLLRKATATVIHQVELLSGPERIESGWWDGNDCRRDYYIARDHRGRRLWLYRDFKRQPFQWFLQGLFG